MRNSNPADNSQPVYDLETGELNNADADLDTDNGADDIFRTGEGRSADGSIIVGKITAATIRANPERAKIHDSRVKLFMVTGMAGSEYLMPRMGDEARLEAMPPGDPERDTFTALVSTVDAWGCVRYGDDGEPDAVFRADYLFLPLYHKACLNKLRRYGTVALALEFWAIPSSNPRGYAWHAVNLAQIDRRNLSPVERMIRLGIEASRALDKASVGTLLSDLRRS